MSRKAASSVVHPAKRPLRAAKPKLDPRKMAQGIALFLEGAGLDLGSEDLRETPERVAETWRTEFLDGYAQTARAALAETYPAPGNGSTELVVLTDLRFHSMCPHHLLPISGRAHVAYVPSERVVGFGRISRLLDCFAHRLILQEALARSVARALVEVLGSPGAACILEGEHACLRLRGPLQTDAIAHTEAYEGTLREGPLRAELWARIGARASEERDGR